MWNRWREENPGIHPDLSDSIMAWIAPSGEGDPMTKGYRADLRHLNLTNTDLTRANFESVDLNHSDFTGAKSLSCCVAPGPISATLFYAMLTYTKSTCIRLTWLMPTSPTPG